MEQNTSPDPRRVTPTAVAEPAAPEVREVSAARVPVRETRLSYISVVHGRAPRRF